MWLCVCLCVYLCVCLCVHVSVCVGGGERESSCMCRSTANPSPRLEMEPPSLLIPDPGIPRSHTGTPSRSERNKGVGFESPKRSSGGSSLLSPTQAGGGVCFCCTFVCVISCWVCVFVCLRVCMESVFLYVMLVPVCECSSVQLPPEVGWWVCVYVLVLFSPPTRGRRQ